MSENTQCIDQLKRKAKQLNEKASIYEFGFETPSKKKSNDETKQVFAVFGEKNRFRRDSTFIESSNLESNEKTSPAKQKEIHPNVIYVTSDKQIVAGQINTAFDGIIVSSVNTQTNESIGQNAVTEFQLNAENDDDLLIQNTLGDNSGTVPLLFRNNYFKITSQRENDISAMCINCGLDENNQPKTILKSQKNVSSNFISHLKVKYYLIWFLLFLF